MTTTDTPATGRQLKVLDTIRDYWREFRRPPSIRDLCEVLGIGSPNGVVCHLRALDRRGLIEWDRSGTARGIWPAGLAAYIAACPLLATTPEGTTHDAG